MYYEEYQPDGLAEGKGKPIVLLHGSFVNIPLNWSHILPRLAKDRKVIVAEMQDHGRTKDIPRDFSYEGMADDVSGLLEHLKIDSADILGYSMGGGVAFQMAVRHPQKVRRLVVLSGTYAHDGWWPDIEAMYPTMTADMFKGTPIEEQYISFGNDPALFPEFVKKVISIDLKPYDWSEDVKNIKAPIFMAIGDADGVRYKHALELFRAKGSGKMGIYTGCPNLVLRFYQLPPELAGENGYHCSIDGGLLRNGATYCTGRNPRCHSCGDVLPGLAGILGKAKKIGGARNSGYVRIRINDKRLATKWCCATPTANLVTIVKDTTEIFQVN